MTSYALAKSESKSNWGFVFFFSMMFASCFKNEPLFLIHVYLIIECRVYPKENSNFYITIQTYFSYVSCMIDVFC